MRFLGENRVRYKCLLRNDTLDGLKLLAVFAHLILMTFRTWDETVGAIIGAASIGTMRKLVGYRLFLKSRHITPRFVPVYNRYLSNWTGGFLSSISHRMPCFLRTEICGLCLRMSKIAATKQMTVEKDFPLLVFCLRQRHSRSHSDIYAGAAYPNQSSHPTRTWSRLQALPFHQNLKCPYNLVMCSLIWGVCTELLTCSCNYEQSTHFALSIVDLKLESQEMEDTDFPNFWDFLHQHLQTKPRKWLSLSQFTCVEQIKKELATNPPEFPHLFRIKRVVSP